MRKQAADSRKWFGFDRPSHFGCTLICVVTCFLIVGLKVLYSERERDQQVTLVGKLGETRHPHRMDKSTMIAMVRNLTGFVVWRFVKQCVIRSVLDYFIVGSLLFYSCGKHGSECKFLVLSGYNALNVVSVVMRYQTFRYKLHQVHLF